ncbi:MAG: rhodanese-like domain-containing protein, partial [Gemmatimonadota bacterium]
YEVALPHRALREGDEVRVGEVRLRTVHTPGHTPEHVAFLIYDGRGEAPARFLTGDFLLIGSLGRPDLLGEDEREALSRALYQSVRRVLPGLPDDLWIHPAHGAGSLCGGGMSAEKERRLGTERTDNPLLDPALDADDFVRRLLDTVPAYPDYYLRMKARNAGGEGFDRPWPEPVARGPEAFQRAVDDGAMVVDTRHLLAFGGGHVPGALGIGLHADLSQWAGWTASYDRPLALVTDRREDVKAALTRLARVGLDRVDAFLDGGMDAWLAAARPVATLPQLPVRALHERIDGRADDEGPAVLDVRTDEEWERGHIDGAIHVMGGHLQAELDRLPDRDREIAVTCSTGYRSTVAASILQRNGFRRVWNVPGGMDAWTEAGLPVAGETAD